MTTFSEQFPIVFQALNVGFLQTLKLFFVTLIGAIPLGLIISFGSMSRWSPLGFLRPYLKNLPKDGKLTWWQKTQLWFAVDFRPIRLIVRFVIWVVRGTPLMLQLLVFYYFPGLVLRQEYLGQRRGRALPRIVDRVHLQLRVLFLRDLPRRHPGRPEGAAGGRAGARHDAARRSSSR